MRSGIVKAVWLHIFSEGGTWTPDEIAEQFNLKRQQANLMLQCMASRTKSLRRSMVNGRTAFSVVGSCTVPLGVTIGEMNCVYLAGPAGSAPILVDDIAEVA